jgi:glycosyltransferase involved in cell wall biosynthesis
MIRKTSPLSSFLDEMSRIGLRANRSSGDGLDVLFMTSCQETWGGSEELWAGAAERLAARKMRIAATRSCAIDYDHPRFRRLLAAGIPLESLQFETTATGRLGRFLRRAFRRVSRLWRSAEPSNPQLAKLKAWNPAVALISQGCTYDGMAGINLVSLCDAAQIPYALVCQKSSEITWPSDRNRDYLQGAFERALRVFFVSRHNLDLTEKQLGRTLPNAEVVRNPFMVNTRQPLPWPRLQDGVLRLACVARLWVLDKGQDILLAVLAAEKWKRRRIEVNFFGAGDNARALEEMAAMLGLECVHFRGFSNDVEQIWRDHHALVLPSRAEGLPLALIEAMICGRIGIVTATGGSAEVISEGITGFLARHPTVEGLDEALERAWQSAGQWEAMGRQASHSIWNHFPEDPCGVFAEKVVALHRLALGLSSGTFQRTELAEQDSDCSKASAEVEQRPA